MRTKKFQNNDSDFKHFSPELSCDDWDTTESVCNGKWLATNYGSGIFASEDNDGTSYYFRGAVDNNNVRFANMDWKILRVNGDGTIRLILNGNPDIQSSYNYNYANDNHKNAGYTVDNSHNCTDSNPCISDFNLNDNSFVRNYGTEENDGPMKTNLEEWYIQNLKDYNDQIALTKFCNDTSYYSYKESTGRFEYNSERRVFQLGKPILKCSNPTNLDNESLHNYGGVYKLKIGLISVDEITMAGYKNASSSGNKRIDESNFLYFMSNIEAWTMSPSASGTALYSINGHIDEGRNYVARVRNLIPVINLKSNLSFSGDGTKDNPYTIK